MSTEQLSVDLFTPQKPLANLKASFVEVPGVDGYMGIGPKHTKLMSLLQAGIIKIDNIDQKTDRYFISKGFLTIEKDHVTILADVIEKAKDIDSERAKAAEIRAIQRLQEKTNLDINIPRALASLERARARLSLLMLGK